MGRALAIHEPPPTPVNLTPVLMCAKQERFTLHRFAGERPVMLSVGEKLYEQLFACVECGEQRRFGLDVE